MPGGVSPIHHLWLERLKSECSDKAFFWKGGIEGPKGGLAAWPGVVSLMGGRPEVFYLKSPGGLFRWGGLQHYNEPRVVEALRNLMAEARDMCSKRQDFMLDLCIALALRNFPTSWPRFRKGRRLSPVIDHFYNTHACRRAYFPFIYSLQPRHRKPLLGQKHSRRW